MSGVMECRVKITVRKKINYKRKAELKEAEERWEIRGKERGVEGIHRVKRDVMTKLGRKGEVKSEGNRGRGKRQ